MTGDASAIVEWLNAASTSVVAVGTIALAVATGAMYFREQKRERERQDAADAKVSAIAYPLQERLLDVMVDLRSAENGWQKIQSAQRVTEQLDELETQVADLIAASASASDSTAKRTANAATAFFHARSLLMSVADADEYTEGKRWAARANSELSDKHQRQWRQADEHLLECGRSLLAVLHKFLRTEVEARWTEPTG